MIQIRTRAQYGAVIVIEFIVGLLAACVFLLVYLPLGTLRFARQFALRVRRAIKPAALWLNAWLYQASEEEIQFRGDLKSNIAAQGVDVGRCLRLSAEQHRLHMWQRRLRAARERMNQW
jgi:hypothetical protein